MDAYRRGSRAEYEREQKEMILKREEEKVSYEMLIKSHFELLKGVPKTGFDILSSSKSHQLFLCFLYCFSLNFIFVVFNLRFWWLLHIEDINDFLKYLIKLHVKAVLYVILCQLIITLNTN